MWTALRRNDPYRGALLVVPERVRAGAVRLINGKIEAAADAFEGGDLPSSSLLFTKVLVSVATIRPLCRIARAEAHVELSLCQPASTLLPPIREQQ